MFRRPLWFEVVDGARGGSGTAAGTGGMFVARGSGASFVLTTDEIQTRLRTAGGPSRIIRMKFVNASAPWRLSGEAPLDATVNRLKGRDPGGWRVGQPVFSRVRCEAIYPGVDCVAYGRDGQVEFDLVIRPGADAASIEWMFLDEADRPLPLELSGEGDLIVSGGGGEVVQHRPVLYQPAPGGKRKPVTGRFRLSDGSHVGVEIGPFDPSLPLIVDPVVTYSTFLGGTDTDVGVRVAVDDKGFIYVGGVTFSNDFPTTFAIRDTMDPAGDMFVAKFSPDGQRLIFSTYLGGTGDDYIEDMIIRPEGLYVCGYTQSADFPVPPDAFQPNHAGNFDAFVLELSLDGQQVLGGTLLGGAQGYDVALGIFVDDRGFVYLTGQTQSSDFPTSRPLNNLGVFQGGFSDAFVAVLRDGGRGLLLSTFLGGEESEEGYGISLDALGQIVVAGRTSSKDFFPRVAAFQPTFGGGLDDAFVCRIDPIGPNLLYSTFLGGSQSDAAYDLAMMPGGRPVIAGRSSSPDFPLQRPIAGVSGAGDDAFAIVMESDGSALAFSTRLGGGGRDQAQGVVTDSTGSIYLAGWTRSVDFPTTQAYQPTPGGVNNTQFISDAFAARLDPVQSRLVYSTYLGGMGNDQANGLTLSAKGHLLVVGETDSFDFPAFSAWQPRQASASAADAFVAQLVELPPLAIFDPPRVVRSMYVDLQSDGVVEAGEPLTLIFDHPIRINPDLLDAGSVLLPVEGDSIGGILVQTASRRPADTAAGRAPGAPGGPIFQVNPLNDRQLIVRLGDSPVLNPDGDFDPAQLVPGSPSGIDIAPGLPPTAIASIYGVPAEKNPDVAAVDVRFNFRVQGRTFDEPTTETVIVQPNTQFAAYRNHALVIPPSAASNVTILLKPNDFDPRVTNALQIEAIGNAQFNPPAQLRLQYLPAEVDRDAGQMEQAMRIHQLVRMSNGELQWVRVPGAQSVDRTNKWVTISLSNLNPVISPQPLGAGGAELAAQGQVGVFGNIPGETVEEASLTIKPSPGEAVEFMATPVLRPGSRGFYTQHAVEFPGWVEAAPDDPARIQVRIRKPLLFDLVPVENGQEWPLDSAAVFVIEARDAADLPVAFPDPVNITVQFFDGTQGTFDDVWKFDNQKGQPEGMSVANDQAEGFGVDFDFTPAVINQRTLGGGGGLVRVTGVTALTDNEGVGVWGAVAGDAAAAGGGGWMLH
ncbi:MAG: hypothetical protein Kow0059_15480 [Candidatus Sumerlaeia bacterium]